jgi:methionine synthase II (cobalamin-independent)
VENNTSRLDQAEEIEGKIKKILKSESSEERIIINHDHNFQELWNMTK